ncbi:hypothetical protein HB662_13750 [Roseomonas frigidaquae]|uniref:DUF2934 domain-containing protein n=1 Tax=Falsiroseomonas frigidaquae TaxID=487318 RepID=A0ABX1F0J2_9PROT|nr:hypothetical protein [Falsiroseomonas frigidaquae]NKE45850.1 hypothetical protein [Falsiroseomonas frigidaquae]
MAKTEELTEAQRAYEARRAAKAGMSLDKWLAEKARRNRAEESAAKLAEAAKAKEPEKKGWFGRLMDRAHKPIK